MGLSKQHKLTENARRLSNDARWLLEGDRLKTAMAIAILSLEESGKYIIKFKTTDVNCKAMTNHVFKQQASMKNAFAEIIVDAFMSYISDSGLEIKHVTQMNESQKYWLSQQVDDEPAGFREGALARFKKENVFEEIEKIKNGNLNRIKQAGFYFDVDSNSADYDEEFEFENVEKWVKWSEDVAAYVVRLANEEAGGLAKTL